MNEIKSGLRTSEFWLAVLPYVGQLVVVVLFALGYIDEQTFLWLMGSGFIGGSFASKGYSDARAQIKSEAYWRGSSPTVEVNAEESVG